MATYFLSQTDNPAVTSLVIIGMSPGINGTENINALGRVKVPVLDLYGSQDLEPVLNSVELRAAAGNKGADREFQQSRVAGAGHFFQGQEDALVQQVIDWLEAQGN